MSVRRRTSKNKKEESTTNTTSTTLNDSTPVSSNSTLEIPEGSPSLRSNVGEQTSVKRSSRKRTRDQKYHSDSDFEEENCISTKKQKKTAEKPMEKRTPRSRTSTNKQSNNQQTQNQSSSTTVVLDKQMTEDSLLLTTPNTTKTNETIQSKDDSSNDQCGICLEVLGVNVAKLECAHSYCMECIQSK